MLLALFISQSLQKLWAAQPIFLPRLSQKPTKRPTLSKSTPNTLRVRSVKGKSGSRICGISFHLSAWRFTHQNIMFKRNLWWIKRVNSIYIACSACWLCKWTLSLHPQDSCLSPPQLPGSQLPESESVSHSVMSSSLQPHGLYPSRLLCPWNSPGKNTGVSCPFLLPTVSCLSLKLFN